MIISLLAKFQIRIVMAEQEVIKHTKKIYKIWNNKGATYWHKAKEFLLEIIIIVFAISLSIWFHDRSEHNHQQKEVKEFLLGLREDLLSDINEMQDDKASYIKQGQAFKYITGIKLGQGLSTDSLNKYDNWLSNITRLQQNNGRFEGFKASGKIGTIEDKKIQNDIMDLYQEAIPSLLLSADSYIRRKNEFFDFKIKNQKKITDTTSNLSTILLTDEAQNLCGFLANTGEIITRYDICLNKMKIIVNEIEDKYGN
jgi:hypothetical protein